MTTSNDDSPAKRAATELEMTAAATTGSAHAAHRELAVRDRQQTNGTAANRPPLRLDGKRRLAARHLAAAATDPAQALAAQSRSQPEDTADGYRHTIEERPDARGISIYVVVQNGIDLTSRWTRDDAETEVQRLDAVSPSGLCKTLEDFDYFTRRAQEADQLAACAGHPAVRAVHESFAAAYRAHAGPKRSANTLDQSPELAGSS